MQPLTYDINNYKAPVKLRRRQDRKLATPSQGEYNQKELVKIRLTLPSKDLAKVLFELGSVKRIFL